MWYFPFHRSLERKLGTVTDFKSRKISEQRPLPGVEIDCRGVTSWIRLKSSHLSSYQLWQRDFTSLGSNESSDESEEILLEARNLWQQHSPTFHACQWLWLSPKLESSIFSPMGQKYCFVWLAPRTRLRWLSSNRWQVRPVPGIE